MFSTLNYLYEQVRSKLTPSEDGQGLVEYSIVVVLIAIAAIAILSATSSSINSEFQKIISGLR